MNIAVKLQDLFQENIEALFHSKKFSIQELCTKHVNEEVAAKIRKLYEKGHNISIMTPFVVNQTEGKLGKRLQIILQTWLESNHIPYHHLDLNIENIEDYFLNSRIDVLIDLNNSTNQEENRKMVNVITLSESTPSDKGLYPISHIDNLEQTIEKIEEILNTKINVIQNPDGRLSIDKPYLKGFTFGQLQTKIPAMNSVDYLFYNNREHLEEDFIYYFGNRITYVAFKEKIEECAKSFIISGVKSNDIVGLCMPNIPECIIAMAALKKIGATAQMIHPLLSQEEIKKYLQISQSKLLIMADISYNNVKNILSETAVESVVVTSPKTSMPKGLGAAYSTKMSLALAYESYFGTDAQMIPSKIASLQNFMIKIHPDKKEAIHKKIEDLHKEMLTTAESNSFYKDKPGLPYITWNNWIKKGTKSDISLPIYQHNPTDITAILQSGGSSGTPKCVEVYDKAFITEVEQFRAVADSIFGKEDVILIIMPFFHGFGLISSFYIPACLGVKCVFVPKFHAKELPELIEKYHITAIAGVPTLLRALLNNPNITDEHWRQLKIFISGGSILEKKLLDDFQKKQEQVNANTWLWNGYGQAETSTGVTLDRNPTEKEGSIGVPNIGNDIKIVRFGTEEEVGYNIPGELCVTGETIMKGYLNNPEATEKTKRTHADGKTWIHTNDIAMWDLETNRLVYINRASDMIISGGYNLYPSEIAKAIYLHPAVLACAIIGVEDEFKGEVPNAFIVLKPEIEATERLKQEIYEVCKQHISLQSLPTSLEFIDRLPQTSLGKIETKQLRDKAKQLILDRGENK